VIDALLSILALAGFVAFLLVLGWWVREPDLLVVLALGAAFAAYDFWRAHRTRP
jgi:hypothetical protein